MGVPHALPMLGVDHYPGAEGVSHDPAGDLPRRGSLQRFDHFEPIVVRQPNVKDQVDVILCGIDICYQGLNAGIRIRQQFPVVTTDGFETVDGVADAKEVRVTLWDLRSSICRAETRRIPDIRHASQHLPYAAHATAADVGLTEEKVRNHSEHR